MTQPPEALRLFDVDASQATSSRRTADGRPPSRKQTPVILSAQEATAERVQETDNDDNVLHALAEQARLVADARRRLDEAIDAARAAGHSWRAIGIHTGIPYQTLHQRSDQRGRAANPAKNLPPGHQRKEDE